MNLPKKNIKKISLFDYTIIHIDQYNLLFEYTAKKLDIQLSKLNSILYDENQKLKKDIENFKSELADCSRSMFGSSMEYMDLLEKNEQLTHEKEKLKKSREVLMEAVDKILNGKFILDYGIIAREAIKADDEIMKGE